jgi:hypothetical protein
MVEMKNQITVLDIMDAKPCNKYPQAVIKALWKERESLSPKEISELKIPIEDRLWALIKVVLNERDQRLFSCDCAERTLLHEKSIGKELDIKNWDCIQVSRKFAQGLITEFELASASFDVVSGANYVVAHTTMSSAYSAASYASNDSARFIASSTAYYVSYASGSSVSIMWSIVYNSEYEWQIQRILEMVENAPL